MIEKAMGMVGELRRRRVIRVLLGYCALSWLVLDVSDTLLPALGLPDWSIRLVVGLLILGLPVTIMLAWAFDLTSSGVQRTPPRSRPDPHTTAAGSRRGARDGTRAEGAEAAADRRRKGARPDGRRVVVALPFLDRSPGGEHQFLGDGITEELINGLATVDGLHVVSRTSAFAFRDAGQDVREIGTRLGACCVVEGSLRVASDELRLTVQLVDVENGYVVWSGRYDRELADVFEVEEEVARSLAAQLQRLLHEGGGEAVADEAGATGRLLAPSTRSIEAYRKYLRGRAAWNRRTPGSLLAAIGYFDAALRLDPGYPQASAGLADAYALLMEFGHLDPRDGLESARAAVGRAIADGPELAETHTALGLVRQVEWRWEDADAAFRHAAELNPGYSVARQRRALLLAWLGRREASRRELDDALGLDPLSPAIRATDGWVRYYAGDPEGALATLGPVVREQPEFGPATVALALSLAATGRDAEAADSLARLREASESPPQLALHACLLGRAGREDDARRAMETLERLAATRYVSAYHRALPRLGLGRIDAALDWLERARLERAPQLVYAAVDPLFDPLRDHQRFRRILDDTGLGDAGPVHAARPTLVPAAAGNPA